MIMMGDKKKLASVILGPDPNAEPEKPMEPIKVIAQELIEAVHSRNVDDVVSALRAAFQEFDAEPHYEGSHEDSEA